MEDQSNLPHSAGPKNERTKNELRWHDGFVVQYGEIQDDEGGAGTVHQYSLFFPIDAADEVVTTPVPTVRTFAFASRTYRIHKQAGAR